MLFVGILSISLIIQIFIDIDMLQILNRAVETNVMLKISIALFMVALLIALIFARQIISSQRKMEKKLKREIAEHKLSNEYLEYLKTKDPLTGVSNRNLLHEHLRKNIDDFQLDKRIKAVITVNFDNFKQLNNYNSYSVGDEILKQFTKRAKSCLLKSDDDVFRTGGNEFVIYLSDIRHDIDAGLVAGRIQKTCSTIPYHVKTGNTETEINSSVSMGISVSPKDGRTSNDLLKYAGLALNHAKKQGKGRYCFYNKDMDEREQQRIEIRKKLIDSLKNDYITAYFQPIVGKDGKIKKFEALARINYPNEGLISPIVFIPVAEETELIEDLGNIILEKACRAARIWHHQSHEICASVNVSSRQLREGFYKKTMSILDKTQFNPKFLYLEITEETIMNNPENSIREMRQLRKKGVHFSIDDFGTGYSSFTRMRDLPIDEIKIDRAFLRNITRDNEGKLNRAMIQGLVSITKAQNINLITEGAETEDEIKILYELGCNDIQGYYFSKPIPYEGFTKIIDRIYTVSKI